MGLFSLAAVALFSLEIGLSAPVPPQPLVTIVSEPQGHLEHRISLSLDHQGHIVEVVRESAKNRTVASAADLVRGRVALAGRESVFLSCPSCDPASGGSLVLEYLNNGLTGTYASRALRLDRHDGAFRLSTLEGRPVARLRLTARRMFGLLIGIGDVVVE